ncbi:MAG: MFS transporter [Chloroflexi bacterium]|nr:MFS transporter [Chloroflexota bacterium]
MPFRLAGQARILLHIYLPSVLMGFGLGMLLPTLPILARGFGVAPELAAQAITAYLIGRAGFLFPAGYIVDHFGRRPAMSFGPLIVVAGVSITATTPWFPLVFLGQALVGAGEGLWSLGREIAAVEEIRAESRGRVIGAFFGISSAGTTLGPVLGGLLTDRVGYAAVFASTGVFALVVSGIGMSYRDRPRRAARASSRPSIRRPFDAIAPGYLTTFQVLMFASFCAMLRSTAVQSLLPVYVVSDLGYSASDAGYLFGVTGIVQLLMIAPAGYLSDKVGRKAAVVPAAALAGVSYLGFYLSQEPVGLALSAAVLGLSSGLAVGSMTSYTYDIVAPDARGTIQAFRRSIGEFGSFSGPVLGGLVASISYAGMAFLAFAPLHLASALLVGLMAKESLGRTTPAVERAAASEAT